MGFINLGRLNIRKRNSCASALVSLSDVQPPSVYKSHILNGPINKLYIMRVTQSAFKVNGFTFRGINSFIFIFVSHLIRGKLLKKRICSQSSKFYLLRGDLILRAISAKEANRMDGWMTCEFTSFSTVLSGRCVDDNERLFAMQSRFRLR